MDLYDREARTLRHGWGERIRAAREAAGMSTRQAAAELGAAQSTVLTWETGDTAIDQHTMARIARAYGTPLAELYGIDGT